MRLAPFPCDRQLDMMDCGPACLKMIAKYYGKYYSLQYLRHLCGISKEGVSLLGLSHAAEDIGLRSLSAKSSFEELAEKIPLPAIVHWRNSHFVVVYKVSEERGHWGKGLTSVHDKFRVHVSDPAKGLISHSKKDFVDGWMQSGSEKGVVLVLEPQSDFKQRQAGEHLERKKTFENILGYFLPYKKSFVNLFLVMLLVTLMQASLPFISKAVIDIGIQTRDLDFINVVLIANITLIVCITLCNAARDWILQHLTSRINIALISDYLIKLMKLPVTFFENKMMGDILQRASDHERIRGFIMNNSISLIFSLLTLSIFGVILLTYNETIFYIFSIGSILYGIWILSFLHIRKKLDWELFELNSKNQSYWIETVDGIVDIKLNNYEKRKRWKWESIQARLYNVNLKVLGINNVQILGGQFIDSIKNLLITFFCAKSVINGEISFGVMISTQFMIGMLNGPVLQFIQFITSFQFAQISFLRLNEIHQMKDEDEDVGNNDMDLPKNKDLVLSNVAFQYNSFSPYVLTGIFLRIPEGKVTAIVGSSGSGKSTLLRLLLRLYRPSYGEISMGGMNLNNIGLRQWRDRCGAVMQDGKIFNDTILNNIVLDDENIDLEKLRRAVETANIAEEIEELPLGYQTKMGEQGRGLSGGQKQRILIARALYKDPDYLFFDEATNALDTINEERIVKALEGVFKHKTVIVVAHRLSTIRNADQIVVMKSGTVIEIGNHESLLSQKGHYYDLVRTQSGMSMENGILPMRELAGADEKAIELT